MNHNGDNSPSMDYYELRRRHEQFKKRHAINEASDPKARPAQNRPVKPVEAPSAPLAEEPLRVSNSESPIADAPTESAPVQPEEIVIEPENASPAPANASAEDDVIDIPLEEELIDDEYSDEDADFDEDEDVDHDGNPNPFESFISLFHGVQNRLRRSHSASEEDGEEDFDEDEAFEAAPKRRRLFGRKKNIEDEYVDFDDSDYAEEDYIAEEFPDEEALADASEAENIPSVQSEPADEASPAAKIEDVEDIEDIADVEEAAPVRRTVRRVDDESLDEEDASDEDFEEDNWDDENFDEEEAPGDSVLKRFVSLFVVRDDEDHDEDDDEEDDILDSASEEEDFSDQYLRRMETVSLHKAPSVPERRPIEDEAEFEGGPDMDEKNKLNLEMTAQMAAGLESCGMSRRERRELAERQAAAEAAKCAAEEAARLSFEEEPLVADSVKDVSRGIAEVDSAPIDLGTLNAIPAKKPAIEEETSDADLVDEPTREFKPLSKRAGKAAVKNDPLFSFDSANDEEDEDDEDEEDEKPSRFSLFRGKKHADEDEDEDEEDEDDDYDEDDDDEDDEPVRKKSRHSRRTKKSRSARYDEDDEEDEDDYDEYDEYDEDDEEDDYDDYDEDDDYDDEGEGFGRAVLGFLKGLVGLALFLLIIVFALNALDFFNVVSLDGLYERYYNKAPGVFDTLFPGHEFKLRMNAQTDSLNAIDPLNDSSATAEPYASPIVTEVPSVTEAPVITEAPVVTEAPAATEVPAVTEAPTGTVG